MKQTATAREKNASTTFKNSELFSKSDIQQFNKQYPTLTVNHTSKMHDRFLIIDQKILYHIGASLKDLGKKCFAFEILDKSLIPHLLTNL